MDSREAPSEETEQLCDNTIDLIKAFQAMLQATGIRSHPTEMPSQHIDDRQQPETQLQPPQHKHRQQQQQQQQPPLTICSNVSNLASCRQQTRVLTSPSEIRLVLRLESWLSETGDLMVKPSIRRESSTDPIMASAVNNNTAVGLPRPATGIVVNSDTADDGAGDFDEACDDCMSGAAESEKDLLLRLQQQQKLLLQHCKRQQQLTSSKNSSAGNKPRHHHHNQPQQTLNPAQQRDRLVSKRPVTVASSGTAGKIGSSGSRARRDTELGREETMKLIRQLHQLLGSQLKAPSTSAE